MKDIHTNDYFNDTVRFADLVNGVVHDGQQIVKPCELEETDKEFLYTAGHKGKKIIADNAKLWKKYNVVFALYAIENLSYVDYATVIRCMMTEAMAYHKQWKEYKLKHERDKDLEKDEFLSKISRSDAFYPVVPIVVYYGTDKEWDAYNSLHELLGTRLPPSLKKYVNNYKVNLFDYHCFDSFNQFQTEIKAVFECLRYNDDGEKFKKLIKDNEQRYRHLDSDTGKLIGMLTNNKAIRNYQESKMAQEGGELNMSKAIDDIEKAAERKGKIEGKTDSLRSLMSTMNWTLEKAMDALLIPDDEREAYKKAI
ncbi:MAG: Rpn family recombination-promoting nuclease/putative transposase [Clostridium sp.]|nr:Rpn family recombination-promoting nuclease/putative transposase [Clostridium sp.]